MPRVNGDRFVSQPQPTSNTATPTRPATPTAPTQPGGWQPKQLNDPFAFTYFGG